jgi:hypothetical protein
MIIQPVFARTPINVNIALPVDMPFDYSVRILCGRRTCEAWSAIDTTLHLPDQEPLRITLRKKNDVIAQALSADDRVPAAYRMDVRVLMHQIGTIILSSTMSHEIVTVTDLWREAHGLGPKDKMRAGAWMLHITPDFAICTGTPYSEARIENRCDEAEQWVLREAVKKPAFTHDMAPDHFRLPEPLSGVVTLPVFLSPKLPASGHAKLARIANLHHRVGEVLAGITADPDVEVLPVRDTSHATSAALAAG